MKDTLSYLPFYNKRWLATELFIRHGRRLAYMLAFFRSLVVFALVVAICGYDMNHFLVSLYCIIWLTDCIRTTVIIDQANDSPFIRLKRQNYHERI